MYGRTDELLIKQSRLCVLLPPHSVTHRLSLTHTYSQTHTHTHSHTHTHTHSQTHTFTNTELRRLAPLIRTLTGGGGSQANPNVFKQVCDTHTHTHTNTHRHTHTNTHTE